jgi:hypothetical protein
MDQANVLIKFAAALRSAVSNPSIKWSYTCRLALHDTNHTGGRRTRGALARRLRPRYESGAENAPFFESPGYRSLSPDRRVRGLRVEFRSGAQEMPHVKDWMRYRFGCPRAPTQLLWNRSLLLGDRASDRHRQLPSYLLSATIFFRLLTCSNETELEFRFGRTYRVVI